MENQETINIDSNQKEDKTVAIISYITIIGWVIALVMYNGGKKSKLGAFHIRQSLGVLIAFFAIWPIAFISSYLSFFGILINLSLLAVSNYW